MRAFCFFIIGVVLAGCASTRVPPPDESDLGTIIDDVRAGRIDACRDQRWPTWRFAHDQVGRVRIEQLLALSNATEVDGDDDAARQARSRIEALHDILTGVLAASNAATWRKGFTRGEARFVHWRDRVAAVAGDGLPALGQRRALWSRGYARIVGDRRLYGEVVGNVELCFIAPPARESTYLFARAVIAILDQGRWPNDAQDGSNTALSPLEIAETTTGAAYLRKNWSKLVSAAKAGRMPPGGLALTRTQLVEDPAPAASLSELMQRVTSEWTDMEAFLVSMAPPADVGAELTRRTRLEQYGRNTIGKIRTFGAESKEAIANASAVVWKRVEPLDIDNTARAKALLQTRDWFDDDRDGEGAERFGWLIVQHSDLDPDFQRDVLRRLEPLLAQGRVRPNDYALLWDRVAVKDGRLQRYGTQLTCKDGKWQPIGGVEAPDRLDARRKEMGLGPWRDYVAFFGPCR